MKFDLIINTGAFCNSVDSLESTGNTNLNDM